MVQKLDNTFTPTGAKSVTTKSKVSEPCQNQAAFLRERNYETENQNHRSHYADALHSGV